MKLVRADQVPIAGGKIVLWFFIFKDRILPGKNSVDQCFEQEFFNLFGDNSRRIGLVDVWALRVELNDGGRLNTLKTKAFAKKLKSELNSFWSGPNPFRFPIENKTIAFANDWNTFSLSLIRVDYALKLCFDQQMRKDGQSTTQNEATFAAEAYDQFKSLTITSKSLIEKEIPEVLQELREATLASIDKGRQEQLVRVQSYLDQCVGLQDGNIIDAAKVIARLCEVSHCVLRQVDSIGKTIENSEFIFAVGPRRSGRPIVVKMYGLDGTSKEARVITQLSSYTICPVENLPERLQESVFSKWRNRILGKRIGGSKLTSEEASSAGKLGGKARAEKLTSSRRSEIATVAGKASAKKRNLLE